MHLRKVKIVLWSGVVMTTEVSKEESIDVDATSFAVTSLSLLNSARLNNLYCDFTIKLGDELLTVHKNVLATRSEYFEAMFRSSTSETKTAEVEIRNVDFESVKKCIDYIYTGKASVKQENIEKLMHVAHMMRLEDLCNAIGKFLEKFLNHVTCFTTKRLAHTYNCNVLETKCDEYALANFEAVSTKEPFTKLEKEYLVHMLSSATLVASESAKLNAIRKWIHVNMEEREILFSEFLEFVNLSKLSTRCYESILQNEPLIYDSASILRKFSMTMLRATATKKEVIAVYNRLRKRFQILEKIGDGTRNLTTSDCLGQQIPVGSNFTVITTPSTLYLLAHSKELYGFEYGEPNSKWKKFPSMQQNYGRPLIVYHQGMIYVINETAGEKFCTSMNKWSSMGNLPGIIYQTPNYRQGFHDEATYHKIAIDSAVTTWNGHIFFIGGRVEPINNQHHLARRMYSVSNIVDYNCSTNTWRVTNVRLTYIRYNAVATTCGDDIYVIGGLNDSNQPCGRAEIFNMSTNVLLRHNPIEHSFNHVIDALTTGHTIYVLGGEQKRIATAIDAKTYTVSSVNIYGADVDNLDYSSAAVIKIL